MTAIIKVETADYNGRWNEKDITFFREKFAKNSSPEEFKHFLDICSKYDLDPRVGHIYLQKYEDRRNGGYSPAAIIIGYHGLLHVANRDALLDGIDSDCLYNDAGEITHAVATVWKKGCAHPFNAKVKFSEFVGTSPLWRSKPEVMIKKVAESTALRKAFNLAGMYIQEEFDQEQPAAPVLERIPTTAPKLKVVEALESTSITTPALAAVNKPRPMTQERFVYWLNELALTPEDVARFFDPTSKKIREVIISEPHLSEIAKNFPGDSLRYVLFEYLRRNKEQGNYPDWGWNLVTGEPLHTDSRLDEIENELEFDGE